MTNFCLGPTNHVTKKLHLKNPNNIVTLHDQTLKNQKELKARFYRVEHIN